MKLCNQVGVNHMVFLCLIVRWSCESLLTRCIGVTRRGCDYVAYVEALMYFWIPCTRVHVCIIVCFGCVLVVISLVSFGTSDDNIIPYVYLYPTVRKIWILVWLHVPFRREWTLVHIWDLCIFDHDTFFFCTCTNTLSIFAAYVWLSCTILIP